MNNLINILKIPTPSGCERNLYGVVKDILSEKKMLPSFRNSFFQQVLLDENNLHV